MMKLIIKIFTINKMGLKFEIENLPDFYQIIMREILNLKKMGKKKSNLLIIN